MIASCAIGTVNEDPGLSDVICQDPGVSEAYCDLKGTAGNEGIYGDVTITTLKDGTTNVQANVYGLAPNSVHGFHIHQYGHLTKDGMGSGGHYNPTNNNHSLPNNPDRHIGDMGNIQADATGKATYLLNSDIIKLTGEHSVIGRTVIVHEKEDDGVSQPTGNAGSRFAQCVLGIKNAANNIAHNPNPTRATCEFTKAPIIGRVLFETEGGKVRVRARVCGLGKNAQKGFHVHTYGQIDNLSNTGGHYNPHGAPHALPPTTPRHVGDMGNLPVFEDGVAYFDTTFDLMKLSGNESLVGRAVIIHEESDKGTGEAGDAGGRLAGCVIGVADNSNFDTAFKDIVCPPPEDSSSSKIIMNAFLFIALIAFMLM